MFKKLLIANRGEIACRIMQTARRFGVACVAVYSDTDAGALHVAMAEEAYRIGPPPAAESYLNIEAVIEAAQRSGAEAVHPGYGFLAENPDFVEACEAAGLVFIGPPAAAIRAMGLKDAAKRLMQSAGVQVIPGYHGENQDAAFLAEQAAETGFPVLIKARAGGGGKGMRRVDTPDAFAAALEGAQREAQGAFGDDAVLIEKYIARPRHIEVQVFADAHGNAMHLFERDCSLQRRHQKVIEEAPAPGMTPELRAAVGAAAVKAALAVGYRGAGTVEFIADASGGLSADRFYFMEMNTRLQVEHPVTEAITGHDLVGWQLRVAAGEPLPATQDELAIIGHAFEARLYAEDAGRGFLPATGRLTHLHLPEEDARVDTGVRQGDDISPWYDPMIAKLIVHGPNRAAALAKLSRALSQCRVVGCVTNLAFLSALSREPHFAAGEVDTGLIEREFAALTAEMPPSPLALAVGALAALGLLREPSGADPWDTLPGWRHWTEARQYALLEWRGERMEACIITQGGGAYEVELPAGEVGLAVRGCHGGHVRIEAEGRVTEAVIVEAPAEVSVFMDGAACTFALPGGLSGDEDESAGEDRVVAPMPGLIKAVHVAPGDEVAKGDALIVVEAMKMEHTLVAPHDGVVAEVLAAPGEQVEDGAVLMRLAAGEYEKAPTCPNMWTLPRATGFRPPSS